MSATQFRKKALVFIASVGAITLVLILLPFAEDLVEMYLASHLGLVITADGSVMAIDGSLPGMISRTSISLAVNIFNFVKIILWMALVILIVRFFSYLIFTTAFRTTGQSEITSLVRTILSVIIYIVSFFVIFQSQYPNVQLAPLFTGSTIIGIVVGLALQDTLGNLFSGIAIQADQPFQVGDVVTISNHGSGVVESVSWRGIKIRTFQNRLLVLSNSVMGMETIEVAPRGNLNARLVHFSTVYETSPSRTIQLVREAVRQVDNVSPKMRPNVRIRDLGPNGIDWEVKYWAEDYAKHNDTDALIRQRIWYLFNREKITFALTARSVYMNSDISEPSHEDYAHAASDHLHHVPIFAPLSDTELNNLAEASATRIFAPGEAIVRQGEQGDSMFVIVRGSVEVRIKQNGAAKTINTLGKNDFFGEMSLLTGEPRTADVIAEGETEVIQIRKAALRGIFMANPKLVDSICEIIDERRISLTATDTDDEASAASGKRGVMSSIKRFFGMK